MEGEWVREGVGRFERWGRRRGWLDEGDVGKGEGVRWVVE